MSCIISLHNSLYDPDGKYCHDIPTAAKDLLFERKKEQCDAVGFTPSNKRPTDSLKMKEEYWSAAVRDFFS